MDMYISIHGTESDGNYKKPFVALTLLNCLGAGPSSGPAMLFLSGDMMPAEPSRLLLTLPL